MPNPHTVNNDDGLSSLWLIARHYQVPLQDLKSLNLHIMNRVPIGHRRHGWLRVGDKVMLPSKAALGNRVLGNSGQRSPKNEFIDDEPWRAFLFVLADEILPSGKLIRKVLELSAPSQAEYILAHPEIFGMKPPNPLSPITLGEHVLGQNNSRYLSASTKPGGAPNIKGRPVYIDIKKARAANVKIHSTAEIIADLDRLLQADPRLQPRVDKLKSVIKPITAESIRQIGGWGGAIAGMKAGGLAGAALGIETGPGAILTGAAGALIFGTAGYFGADWIADFIDSN